MTGWNIYSLQVACEFAVAPVNSFGWKYFFSVWLTNKKSQNIDPYERRVIKIFTDASKGLDLVPSSGSVQLETSSTSFQLLSIWGALHHSCC